MNEKQILSYLDISVRTEKMAFKIGRCCKSLQRVSVFPVPRGGVFVAYNLQKYLEMDIVSSASDADVIVDDVIDSGTTRLRYNGTPFFALYNKLEEPELGWLVFPWEETAEKSIDASVIRVLQYIGEDTERDGLKDTPKRVIKSWAELYSGYQASEESVYTTFEGKTFDQMIALTDIEFYSMCEHHMLPFIGKAHIVYIPDGKVIGISKLARLLEVFSRRLQIQERIGEQITESLMKHLQPIGAACIIEAQHLCMQMRGINKQHSVMKTSSLKGVFLDGTSKGVAVRNELMALIRK